MYISPLMIVVVVVLVASLINVASSNRGCGCADRAQPFI